MTALQKAEKQMSLYCRFRDAQETAFYISKDATNDTDYFR